MLRNIFAVVALAFVALSCGEGIVEPPPPPKDTTPPVVTSVSPIDGAKDVAVASEVKVTFSESVDPATVNVTTFKVMNGPAAVAGSVSSGSPTATFKPAEDFEYSTTYTAVVSGVKDMAGNMLEGEYRWSFTTAVDPNAWTLPVGYRMEGGVAADNAGEYVTGRFNNNDFFVAAFDTSGKKKWLKETANPRYDYGCGIVVADGRVYVGRMDDPLGTGGADVYVDARDASTGELLWSTQIGEQTMCRYIVADESNVYVGSSGDALRLNAQTGEIRVGLTVDDIGGSRSTTSFTSIALGTNAVYLAGTTCKDLLIGGPCPRDDDNFFVVSYSRDLGSRNWLGQWDDVLSLDQFDAGLAVIDGVGVFLNGWSGDLFDFSKPRSVELLAYDIASGELKWHRSGGDLGSTGITTDDKNIYLSAAVSESQSPRPSPMKVELDGNIVWTASPPSRVRSIAVSNGTVFGTDGTNKLLRYDAATGVMKH